MDVERRALPQKVELRAAPEGSKNIGVLAGRAVAYQKESRDLGGWTEMVNPGTFDLANNGRVLARWNHDSNGLLGTTDVGSLRLFDSEDGLDYEIDLPDTSVGRDTAVLAERGDIAFSSFAFRILPDGQEWMFGPNDELVRVVTRAQLVDVAPVADPAYWDSSATLVRSLDLDAIRASIKPEHRQDGTPEWAAAWSRLNAHLAQQ